VDEYRNWLLSRQLDANVTIVDVASAEYFEAAVGSTTGLREDARKYAVLVTDGAIADADELDALQEALAAQGLEASVVTNTPGAWSKVLRIQEERLTAWKNSQATIRTCTKLLYIAWRRIRMPILAS
jgi:hypothetical protein